MKKKREEGKKNDHNKEHIDKGKEEEETKTMTTKINKEEKEDEVEEELNTKLTSMRHDLRLPFYN